MIIILIEEDPFYSLGDTATAVAAVLFFYTLVVIQFGLQRRHERRLFSGASLLALSIIFSRKAGCDVS